MTQHTLISAITLALHDAMSQDERIIIMGQDIGINGGVFRATDTLWQTYGSQRVVDMPLAENLMAEMPIGMAIEGLLPIMEFQFSGFMYPAIESLINHATRMPKRTQSRFQCPIVFRAPFGGGIRAPEHHSETPESLMASIPQCDVVVPSCPNKAYHLLKHSITEPKPTVFLEPKRIYRSVKGPISNPNTCPPYQANLMTTGDQLTIISWGAMLYDCLTAIEQVPFNVELIDLTYLNPIDLPLCLHSAHKTGQVLIVQEGPLACSVASELSANIHEHCHLSLKQPVKRMGAPNDIRPPYQYEKNHYMPSIQKIIHTIHQMMGTQS